MQHKGTVALETPRIILRRFVPEDLEAMFTHCWGHLDVWKWTNYAPMTSPEEAMLNSGLFTTRRFSAYDDPVRYSWAVHSKADNHAIGRVFGMHPSDTQVELAYELGSAWWNQGLMTEAASAAIDFFLRDVGLHRVYAYHADQNPASGRVMQKCGMQFTGIEPRGCTCNAGTFDRVNYELLAEDYLRR